MSRTIYGKIDWADGGKIKFGDPPCDTRIACVAEDVVGCIHWTGEHAGQVEVVISAAELSECNDTYYGCIDFSTGKFQISIPDDCCHCIGCGCNYTNDHSCWAAGKTPLPICVMIRGVRLCSDNSLFAALNVDWCLEYIDVIGAGWYWYRTGWIGATWGTIEVAIFNDQSMVTVIVNVGELYDYDEHWFGRALESDICNASYFENAWEIEHCGNGSIGYGGTAELFNPCTRDWP